VNAADVPVDPAIDLAPYDGVLLQSFGGPEHPEEVMPFLENVTRGRQIPRERLLSVAEHYNDFGGRSPINDQNRALLAALRTELDAGASGVPLVWGNRNWRPYLIDALREAHQGGLRRLVTIVTSAYSSYSGCRQYREDLAAALTTLAGEGRELVVDKIRHYYNHPGFAEATVDAVVEAFGTLGEDAALAPRIVFVTHSIPVAMDARSGPTGHAYTAQHLDLARTVVDGASRRLGRAPGWDLVYCSRSGSPAQPWLEPDICDYLIDQARVGITGVVVSPIGFVSDHMEVIYDLDTEAASFADRLGLGFARAATVGTHPRFVSALVGLLAERAAQARGETVPMVTTGRLGPMPAVCADGCCTSGRP
jgi:ferrochelatase